MNSLPNWLRWYPAGPHLVKTLVALLLFCSAPGFAQETDAPQNPPALEEIVVTADYRGTALFEFSRSATVLRDEDIQQYDASHLGELLNQVANTNFAGGTSRPRFYQIRGIGERSQFASPLNPSVGLIIDGIDMSGLGSAATLFDVDQIEVLRGPQGTRYGANALAGLINIRSTPPSDSFTAKVRTTLASHETRNLGISLSGPVGADTRARFSVNHHRSDGYTDNIFLERDDTESLEELTIHALLDTAFGETQLKINGFLVDIDNGYDGFSFDNDRRTRSDEPGFDRQRSAALAGQLNVDLSGKRLELLTTLARHEQDYGYDEDWTFDGFHPAGYSATDAYLRDRSTYSFEARLLSRDEAARPWVAGLYHYGSREDLERRYTFLEGPFFSDYDFRTTALFAELQVPLGEHISFEGGLRLESRTTDYRSSDGIRFSPDHNMWGGRVALVRQFPQAGRVYLSLTQGFKAGGFNQDGTLPPELRSFDSEYLRGLELGSRFSLFDNRARLSLAVFYDWRVDQQVKSSRVTQRPDGSTEFVDFLGNAARGRNYGLEIEAVAQLDRLRLSLNGGLLHTRFVDFINEFGEDLSGRAQAYAPEYQLAFNLTYRLFDHWHLGAGLIAKDEFYLSDRHSEQSNSHVLTSARVGWRSGRVEVSLWGQNLSDQTVIVRGFGTFGNDPRNGYATEPYYQFGRPRTFGLTLRIER